MSIKATPSAPAASSEAPAGEMRAAGLDRAAIIQRVKEVGGSLGRVPRRDEFVALAGVSNRAYLRHFSGYKAMIRAAGFDLQRTARRYADEDLLRALRDGIAVAGQVVSQKRYSTLGGLHHMTIVRRWRGWDHALVALRDWLGEREPQFPYLPALRHHCALRAGQVEAPLGPRCGELLRFRALDHAPTSEVAVVFLFGLVAEELGFVLETLGTGFPDAQARRRLKDNVWRRVRIEFEHQSRNFRDHGHHYRGCDLVVCWEHNWPDCPVEVLELKREIKRLSSSAR